MNLFNNADLDQRGDYIKLKIAMASDPNNLAEISTNGISIAGLLIEDISRNLLIIKNNVGETNEHYIEIAEAIALSSSGIIKFHVGYISGLVNASDFKQNAAKVLQTKNKLIEATRLMSIITAFPMSPEARDIVSKVNLMITQAERNMQGSKSGCFIATFAFEDYNASEVLFLRYYRDSIIRNKFWGFAFIRIYYNISPSVVKILNHVPFARVIFKIFFKQLVKFLKS